MYLPAAGLSRSYQRNVAKHDNDGEIVELRGSLYLSYSTCCIISL